MKRIILGVFIFIALPGFSLMAQNAGLNPYFETGDFQHWTAEDPSLKIISGPTSLGMDSYCCKKNPGTPDNNGALTQSVHLVEGYTYEFSANIASKYCST